MAHVSRHRRAFHGCLDAVEETLARGGEPYAASEFCIVCGEKAATVPAVRLINVSWMPNRPWYSRSVYAHEGKRWALHDISCRNRFWLMLPRARLSKFRYMEGPAATGGRYEYESSPRLG